MDKDEPVPEGVDDARAAVDEALSAAVAYSLAQTVETRLRGLRHYSRLVREIG